MSFNMSLQAHMRAVRDCLTRFNAKAEFRIHDFSLEVKANGRYFEFTPQYAKYENGKLEYTPMLSDDANYFIGWRHYFNRRWELSNDKIAFKKYCKEKGIDVPALFRSAAGIATDVIVKKAHSSFGDGMQGPFKPQRAMDVTLVGDEYFEEFIPGDIAKIWYWNDKVVALEVKPMVEVVGNGLASVRQLVENIASRVVKVVWPVVETLARYQGFNSVDDIVPEGQAVLVDFRYLSGLHPAKLGKLNALDDYKETRTFEELENAGPHFWQGIPSELREHILYSIDAIIRPNGAVAFLEMNSNPVVHVDAYAPMFASLFGLPSEGVFMPAQQGAVMPLAPHQMTTWAPFNLQPPHPQALPAGIGSWP